MRHRPPPEQISRVLTDPVSKGRGVFVRRADGISFVKKKPLPSSYLIYPFCTAASWIHLTFLPRLYDCSTQPSQVFASLQHIFYYCYGIAYAEAGGTGVISHIETRRRSTSSSLCCLCFRLRRRLW